MKPKVQYIDRTCIYVMTMTYKMSTISVHNIMKLEENILNHITIDTLACISSRN